MRIKKKDINNTPITIDITGPDGNAYNLLGIADGLGNQIYNKDKTTEILKEMKSGDYDNLVKVFDEYFGQVVTIVE